MTHLLVEFFQYNYINIYLNSRAGNFQKPSNFKKLSSVEKTWDIFNFAFPDMPAKIPDPDKKSSLPWQLAPSMPLAAVEQLNFATSPSSLEFLNK